MEVEWVERRSTDTDAHHDPGQVPARLGLQGCSDLTKLGRPRATAPVVTGLAGLDAGRDQRSDLPAPLPDDRRGSEGRPSGLGQPMAQRAFLGRARERRERTAGDRLDLGQEDRPGRRQVPGEGRRPIHQHRPVRDVAGDELLETDRLEATIGLGDGAGLDLAEGRHRGGVLDGLQASRPEPGLVVADEDRSVALRADLDRLDDRPWRMPVRRSVRQSRFTCRGEIRGSPLNDILGVDDRHRPPDELGQRLGDLTEAAARQRDARESVVDRGGTLEARGLDIEDDRQDGMDELVERRLRRELDEREGVAIGRLDHRLRDRLDVPAGLEGHAGQAAFRQPGNERVERDRVVAEWVGRRQQQLVGLHPVEDVRDLHHVDPADRPAQAVPPADDPGAGQRRDPQQFTQRDGIDHRAMDTRQRRAASMCSSHSDSRERGAYDVHQCQQRAEPGASRLAHE